MMTKRQKENYKGLESFINQNKELDIDAINLNDSNLLKSLNWKSIKSKKKEILSQLFQYQRLSRILPKNNQEVILNLLNKGIHASIQIGTFSKKNFISQYIECFKGDYDLAAQCHANAQTKRSKILLEYMRLKT